MKNLILCVAATLIAATAQGAPPSFHDTAAPEGWTIVKGQSEDGALQAKGKIPLVIQTTAPLSLPVEATVRFRAPAALDTITVQAVEEDKTAKPLLELSFTQRPDKQYDNKARIEVHSSGAPMSTSGQSSRRWDFVGKNTGVLEYAWRYPDVKNLWDERDYREIGAADAQLTPLTEKVFNLRMTLTAGTRQIWLDDRLVAEDRRAGTKPAHFIIQLAKTAKVLSVEFAAPADTGRFLPLTLDRYSLLKRLQDSKAECALDDVASVPMRVPKTPVPDIDLGESLDRYRLTNGSGPDAPYVSSFFGAWPDAFRIDPAMLSFRVPYRNYQNVYLLAWVDERPNTVAKGALRFFQEGVGFPAITNFEISPEAIQKGLVKKLDQTTADGKHLYLVRVPADTEGLYGMRDRQNDFLQFDLCKPVMLERSYPDPIFYGYFPAGLPSSIHVAGITLEEAPFGIVDVKPKQPQFVFQAPEKPSVNVTVSNISSKPLDADVRAETASYDGSEKTVATGRASIEPGKGGNVPLTFDLKKLGWHELKVTVEAGGVRRSASLSLTVLPPDTRTHGNALNEERFGAWGLGGHYSFVSLNLRNLGLGMGGLHANHTIYNQFRKWYENGDPAELKKGADAAAGSAPPLFFYGGEWGIDSEALGYGSWPMYTGDGDLPLPDNVRQTVEKQVQVFTAIGKAMRASRPNVKLFLQWGAPAESIAHIRLGMPKELVDGFGMDAPMFELLPEISNALGCMNALWQLRAEAKRFGWPRLPVGWTEGPFFPTLPGSLTERDQMDYQVRYLLLGLAYGVEYFPSAVVPQDAGNYYGAEHYGAGITHRFPLENPKPAVPAVATMTQMVCGADPVGGIDTGCLTTYCLEFQRTKDQAKIYALWRVRGTVDARIKVTGSQPTLTDGMGNAARLDVQDGAVKVSISPSPVWLTGVEKVEGFQFGAPSYDSAPAKVTRPLADMSADKWTYDGSEDKFYAYHHFAVRRITDPNLKAEFGQGEKDFSDAVSITLPKEPGNRPLANRYGALKPKDPLTIPGKPAALGIWIKGNSSWGRVIYQLKDAKGQTWISVGTKDSWNCDDTHAWSYVNFEGWRYVRFPLPGNEPWDSARDCETTWWASHGGDGIVALPLTVEKIFVEARNEVPVLGEMKLVPERSYKLSHLTAEYDSEAAATPEAIALDRIRKPIPEWTGPAENPIAKLAAEATGAAPEIKGFDEPQQEKDGRQMHVRFDQDKALKYNLYVSRYADGRGADLILANVSDNQLATGLRPELTMYLFLTSVGADKKESKPSKPFQLVTHDKFLEK